MLAGSETGQRSASILEMGWKTVSVEKCVREDKTDEEERRKVRKNC